MDSGEKAVESILSEDVIYGISVGICAVVLAAGFPLTAIFLVAILILTRT